MVKMRLKKDRKFFLTTGDGENRKTTVVAPGSIVELTDQQAKNFADAFEEPSASSVGGEVLSDEEKAALSEFRRKKAAEVEAEKAKTKAEPDKGAAQVQALADKKPAEVKK